MNINFPRCLSCPSCKASQLKPHAFKSQGNEIETGIIICSSCRNWYPVIEFIPIVSVNPLLVDDAKKQIQTAWASAFDFSKTSNQDRRLSSEELKLQQHQIEHYTEEAVHYDHEISDTIFWKSLVSNTIRSWADSQNRLGGTILEVGCGTGTTTIQLLQAGHSVVALDICFTTVKRALQKIESLNLQTKPDFLVTEAETLPFPDRSFRTAIFTGVLHHVSKPDQVVKEIGRILTQDGIVYGYENNASMFRFLFDLLMRVCRLWHEEAGPHATISSEEIKQWGQGGQLEILTKSTVFLPPHFFNLFPLGVSKKMLSATDGLFRLIPVMRNHGGLIVISGKKIN